MKADSCIGEPNGTGTKSLKVLGIELVAILAAEKDPVSAAHVQRRYEEDFECRLKPFEYGFASLNDLLEALSDQIVVITLQGLRFYRAKYSEELRDIQNLVQWQNSTHEYANFNRRGSARGRRRGNQTQFGSRYTEVFKRKTGGFDQAEKGPGDMKTEILLIVRQSGDVANDGHLEIPLDRLKTIYEMKFHQYLFDKHSSNCEYAKMLQAEPFNKHWTIEEREVIEGMTRFFLKTSLVGSENMMANQSPKKLSEGGKQLARNTLRNALYFNNRVSPAPASSSPRDTIRQMYPSETSQRINAFNSVETGTSELISEGINVPRNASSPENVQETVNTRNSRENEQSFTRKSSDSDNSEIAQLIPDSSADNKDDSLIEGFSSIGLVENIRQHTREEMFNIQKNMPKDITVQLKGFDEIKRSNHRAEAIQNMACTPPRYGIFASGAQSVSLSTNIIYPIKKEDSEALKKMEHGTQNQNSPSRLGSRFAAPNQQTFKPRENSYRLDSRSQSRLSNSSLESNDRRVDATMTGRKYEPKVNGVASSNSIPAASGNLEVMSKALAAMNTIDDESDLESRCTSQSMTVSSSFVNLPSEGDFAWMKNRDLIIDASVDEIRMCAPMYFVPPRSVLMCFEDGNENDCERFSAIQLLISNYYLNIPFKPLRNPQLGEPCIARSADANEYARAVIVSISHDIINCVCLDYHGFISARQSDLSSLPDVFLPKYLPCNTFFARINQIECIPKIKYSDVGNFICNLSDDVNEASPSVTAVFGIDPVDGRIVVDWLMDNREWASKTIIRLFGASRKDDPAHPTLDEVDAILKNKESQEVVFEGIKFNITSSTNSEVCDLASQMEELIRRKLAEERAATKVNMPTESPSASSSPVSKPLTAESIPAESSKFNIDNVNINSSDSYPARPSPVSIVNSEIQGNNDDKSVHDFYEAVHAVAKGLRKESQSSFYVMAAAVANFAKNFSVNSSSSSEWNKVINEMVSQS